MMICSSASQALQPLQLQKRIQRPTCFRSCTSSSRRRLIHPVSQRIGLQSVLVVRADTGREGPLAEPEEPHSAHEGLSDSAKQLLSVTALAFFTLVATVAKDRATSPIIPPLIPHLDLGAAETYGSSSKPALATATAERTDAAADRTSQAPVRPSRSLLRALWGTATAPVKLVDALLFPELSVPLVGKRANQETSPDSTTAATAAPAAAKPSSKAAAAPHSQESPSSAVPAADHAAAAAGQALASLSQQVDALAAAFPEVSGLSPASGITPDFFAQLQEGVARMVGKQQGAAQGPAKGEDSSTAGDADAAAVLAVLRSLMGPDAMSLLPVLLVTSATAAAGLMLAASMSGVAGLVDKKRATTLAQRAAQAALLDSPLRPISCPTWPGFQPMLPASIEPNYYRWRDTDDAPAAAAAAAAGSVNSGSSGSAAAASAASPRPKEHPLDQEWWSFAQIQALRLMPLLPNSSGKASRTSASSKAAASKAASSKVAAAGAAAAAAAPAMTSAKAAPAAAAVTSAAADTTRDFSWIKASLCTAAWEAADAWGFSEALLQPNCPQDASILLGEAWDWALQLAVVDGLGSPDTAWELAHSFGASAPPALLADVCSMLPAAVAAVRHAADTHNPGTAAAGAAGTHSSWDQSSLLICMLLDPAKNGLSRVQAVCEAMGLVSTAAAPHVLQGVLQQRCQQFVRQTVELEAIPELTYGSVPDVRAWLEDGKQARVALAAAALNSSIMAAYTVAELWGEAVGESVAGAAGASAAAAVEGVSWQQPRLLLRHAKLLHYLLHKVLPGAEALGPLAADILNLPGPIMHTPPGGRAGLLDMQAGPPGGLGYQAHRPRVTAAAILHKQIHAAATSPGLIDAAVLAVSAPVRAAAAAAEGLRVLDSQGVLENVVLALEKSVLAVKLPVTALPCHFRPAWPAAQQLALIDCMLLPSASGDLLQAYGVSLAGDSAGRETLVHSLVLMPAAVASVRSFFDQQLADATDHSALASPEDATATCLRMYDGILEGAVVHLGGDFFEVVRTLGFSTAAVDAAACAVAHGRSIDAAAAEAAAAAAARQQRVERFGSYVELPLLLDVATRYSNVVDGEVDELADAMGNCVLASFAVSLALLLHLAGSKGWPIKRDLDSTCLEAAGEQERRRLLVLHDADADGPSALPTSFWAAVAMHYGDCSVHKLPGGAAAAAVLKALLTESHHFAKEYDGDDFDDNDEAYNWDWDYFYGCARLRHNSSSRQGDSTSSSQDLAGHESWEAGMAAALTVPDGVELEGDEQWREKEDLGSLGRDLPWWSSSDDEGDIERWVSAASDADSDQEGEMESASDLELDVDDRQQGSAGRSDVPHASAHASCDSNCSDAAAQADDLDESGAAAEAGDSDDSAAEADDWDGDAHVVFLELSDNVLRDCPLGSQLLLELNRADWSLGTAWSEALCVVAAEDKGGEGSATDALQRFARTNPAQLVAQLCALLPAAVVNYRQHAAGGGEDKDEPPTASSSWDVAARLVAVLLTPADVADGTDNDSTDSVDAARRIREVCYELGLYWHGGYCSKQPLRGVLQHWAEQVRGTQCAASTLSRKQWGTAASAQAMQKQLEARYELKAELDDMALRSSFMASYMAMELWYAQDCPILPVGLDDSAKVKLCDAAPAAARYPAVLFSHYEMLQHLASGSSGPELSLLIQHASEYAATPRCRHRRPEPEYDADWDDQNREYHEHAVDSAYGNHSFSFLEQPTSKELRLLIRNEPGATTQLLGKLPDLHDFDTVKGNVLQVQDSMGDVLCLSAAALVPVQSDAGSQQQLLFDVVESVMRGEEVVPLYAHSDWHQLLESVGWRPAAQLFWLYMHCREQVSDSAAVTVLQRFAAQADDSALARVVGLLPCAAESLSESDASLADARRMLSVLTRSMQDKPGSIAQLLQHLGLNPVAAAAAQDAAAAAAAPAEAAFGPCLDAAITAAAGDKLPVERPGLLQELWQLHRAQRDTAEGALDALACSALAAAVLLLDELTELPSGSIATAMTAADSAPPAPLLPLEAYKWLVPKFAGLSLGHRPGRAAVAALLHQGLLAAQERDGSQREPAAFRASLRHTLHMCKDDGSSNAALLVSWHGSGARLKPVAAEGGVASTLRGRAAASAAAAAAAAASHVSGCTAASTADAAQASLGAAEDFELVGGYKAVTSAASQPGSPASSTAAAAESSVDSDSATNEEQQGEEAVSARVDRFEELFTGYGYSLEDWVTGKCDDDLYQLLGGEQSREGFRGWSCVAESRQKGWADGRGLPGEGGKVVAQQQPDSSEETASTKPPSINRDTIGSSEVSAGTKGSGSSSSSNNRGSASGDDGPSVAEIRGYGWADGWGAPGDQAARVRSESQGPPRVMPWSPRMQVYQRRRRGPLGVPAANGTSSKAGSSAAGAVAAAAVKETAELRTAAQAAVVKDTATAADAVTETVEKVAAAEAGAQQGAGASAAAAQEELIPRVKKLLGLPVDPADGLSSGDIVPNRLALLMCQAMLLRGDDAQDKLQAAVGYLALAEAAHSLQLPGMLANCMEALFTTDDWESPTGSARQVLSSLSVALPWQAYLSLQKQLMAKGLVTELEVPAEFE